MEGDKARVLSRPGIGGAEVGLADSGCKTFIVCAFNASSSCLLVSSALEWFVVGHTSNPYSHSLN